MILQTPVSDFLTHCRYEKGLCAKTLKAYETDLQQFSLFIGKEKNILETSKNDIREYLISISLSKPKTIKRKIATVKALFNHLEFEDCIIINPFRKLKIRVKEPKVLCRILDLYEVKKIFKTCYKDKTRIRNIDQYSYFECIRNIVIIELLFTTGGRVSEIADLRKDNINTYSGNITIKGKGNKERLIQVCNSESLSVIREYYSLLQSIDSGTEWFLINRFKKKLSDQSIRIIVKNICHRAGINRKVTPHTFRHTFGTMLLEKGVDIRYIQSLLGHSSIITTQIYTHINIKRQRQILGTKHPRKDFSTAVND